MKFKALCFGLFLVLVTASCNAEITGTVVDAETGNPIEGAVVLVEWTISKGLPGMSTSESYKIFEGLTDKEGKIMIPKIYNPLVNPAQITIYKKGYIVWNSEYLFPTFKKREEFQRGENDVFKLDKYVSEFKHQSHISFIHSVIRLGRGDKKLMMDAIEWEERKAFEERQDKRKQ